MPCLSIKKGADMEEDVEQFKADYKQRSSRKVLFILLCSAFAFFGVALSVTIGGYDISMSRVYEVIWDHIIGVQYPPNSREWYDDFIVWNERLPRVLFALVAGIGLATAGVAMQSIMKNPLAEPYTTGVSSGAYFGVAISMALGMSVMASAGSAINALIFSLIPVAVMILLSSRSMNSVATLILVGTAISYMFNAFSTLVLVTTDADTLANVYRWQVGSFINITWDQLTLAAAVVLTGAVVITLLSKKLNIMSMGDENATSLGLNVKRLRVIILIVMAVMVAFIVSYCGIIGFIGLICPHIIRLVIGSDNRFVIPAAAAFGAAFLLIADTVAKWMSALDTVPVGVVVSLIGAPIFLMILVRNRREIW